MKSNYILKCCLALFIALFAMSVSAESTIYPEDDNHVHLTIKGSPLSATYGTDLNLEVEFKSPVTEQDLVWKFGHTNNPWDENFNEIEDGKGKSKFTYSTPELGVTYFMVEAVAWEQVGADKRQVKYVSDTIKVNRYLTCMEALPGTMTLALLNENFGVLATKSDRSESSSTLYKFLETGELTPGYYAVVADPSTCGDDFASFSDHTGNAPKGFGGMFLVNATNEQYGADNLLSIPQRINNVCPGSIITVSAWFRNAAKSGSPLDLTLKVVAANGTMLNSTDFEVAVSEGWKKAETSFVLTSDMVPSVSIIVTNNKKADYGEAIMTLVAIDDIMMTHCTAEADLWGYYRTKEPESNRVENDRDIQTECDGDIELVADPANAWDRLFGNECPYYLWLESKTGGSDPKEWSVNLDMSAYSSCAVEAEDGQSPIVKAIEGQPMYYKAIIAQNSREAQEYWEYLKGSKTEAKAAVYPAGQLQQSCYEVLMTPASKVSCKVEIVWPTIFMPCEENGNNKVFAPFKQNTKHDYIDKEQIEYIIIMDRTGNNVADIKADYWNGYVKNNNMAMPGVYFYVAKLVDDDTVYRGTVELYKEKSK